MKTSFNLCGIGMGFFSMLLSNDILKNDAWNFLK
jgi:hypothetical protein